MALWCRDCRTADLTAGIAPKRITLVLPFYENHDFIQRQAAQWQAWPQPAARPRRGDRRG